RVASPLRESVSNYQALRGARAAAPYYARLVFVVVPIVRRRITVRARDVFHYPYRCDACGLATWAHAWGEGIGVATMAYVAPDEALARARASAAAQQNAWSSFAQSPCPRCRSHSNAQRAMVTAWEQKAASRKTVRFWVAMVGLGIALLWSGGC